MKNLKLLISVFLLVSASNTLTAQFQIEFSQGVTFFPKAPNYSSFPGYLVIMSNEDITRNWPHHISVYKQMSEKWKAGIKVGFHKMSFEDQVNLYSQDFKANTVALEMQYSVKEWGDWSLLAGIALGMTSMEMKETISIIQPGRNELIYRNVESNAPLLNFHLLVQRYFGDHFYLNSRFDMTLSKSRLSEEIDELGYFGMSQSSASINSSLSFLMFSIGAGVEF
jgi:hypothetical protein